MVNIFRHRFANHSHSTLNIITLRGPTVSLNLEVVLSVSI